MRRDLRVLVLEDMPADVELIRFELKRRGIEPHCFIADTRDQFVNQLESHPPDIILSDHGVPGFNGYAALAIAREKYPQVPFLFVTGGEALPPNPDPRWQADGHVSKSNLRQLVPAINEAMQVQAAGGADSEAEAEKEELRALATVMGGDIIQHSRELERRLAELGKGGNMAERLSSLLQHARNIQRLSEELAILAHGDALDARFPLVSVADAARSVMQQVLEGGCGKRIEWIIRSLPNISADSVLLPMILRSLLDGALVLTEQQPAPTLEIGACVTNQDLILWVAYKGGQGAQPVQEFASRLQSPLPDLAGDLLSAPAALVRRLAGRLGGRSWAEPCDDGGGRLLCALPMPEQTPIENLAL